MTAALCKIAQTICWSGAGGSGIGTNARNVERLSYCMQRVIYCCWAISTNLRCPGDSGAGASEPLDDASLTNSRNSAASSASTPITSAIWPKNFGYVVDDHAMHFLARPFRKNLPNTFDGRRNFLPKPFGPRPTGLRLPLCGEATDDRGCGEDQDGKKSGSR